MRHVKDMLNNEVLVNSWIAVSFRSGTQAQMRIGKVIGFGRRTLYGDEIDTIAVEWYFCAGGSLPSKPTSIDSDTAKFIRIPEPTNVNI